MFAPMRPRPTIPSCAIEAPFLGQRNPMSRYGARVARDSSGTSAKADAMVIFGITGDLAKKMTFQALYKLSANGTLDIPVIGVARNDWTEDELRKHARESVETGSEEGEVEIDEKAFDKFAKRLSYVPGDYADEKTYEAVKKAIGKAKHPVFYLEIPPSLFLMVVQHLGKAGLTEGARVVIEKPFGHDLESAKQLNHDLHEILTEDQIYRIDHFLGNEPV